VTERNLLEEARVVIAAAINGCMIGPTAEVVLARIDTALREPDEVDEAREILSDVLATRIPVDESGDFDVVHQLVAQHRPSLQHRIKRFMLLAAEREAGEGE